MNLDSKSVLVLNSAWQPISIKTIREAILSLCSGTGDDKAALALDIQFENEDDEKPSYVNPVGWDEWITLPIRESDAVIHSAKLAVRAPTVCIAVNYQKIPLHRPRPSRKSIYERDKGRCIYTGKQVSYGAFDLEHIMPRSRGGKDTFENLAVSCKDVNNFKGDRTPEEAGLKLLWKPKAPAAMPVSALITQAKHRDWEMFLVKNH
jgi:5-methylcytosine-specific restriction endonuclease McrA